MESEDYSERGSFSPLGIFMTMSILSFRQSLSVTSTKNFPSRFYKNSSKFSRNVSSVLYATW